MKRLSTLINSQKNLSKAFLIAGASLIFSSCSTDDSPSLGIAAVAVTNAIPGGSFNFLLDNGRPAGNPIAFGSKIDYFQAYEGNREAKLTTSTTTTVPVDKLTETINLKPGEYYSMYLVNTVDQPEFLLINDKFPNTGLDKPKVRFINLSPDAPVYDFEIEGDTTTFKNKAFKAYTEFKDVAIKTDAKLLIKDHATGAVKATLTDVDLEKGRIYTIWAKGLNNTTETSQALSIKVSRH